MTAAEVPCEFHCGAPVGAQCQFGNGRGIVDGFHVNRIKQAEGVWVKTKPEVNEVFRPEG